MTAEAASGHRITERIERLSKVEGEARTVRPPLPRSAKIELTSRCNYACSFCASALRGAPQRDMPWPLFVRIARELRKAGVEQLGLFYIGEPLLDERLEEAVRHAKQDCGYPYVFLTTNGSLATAKKVRGLMQAGLDSLKFALNFADADQMARCGGATAGCFEAAVRNTRQACRIRDQWLAESGKRCTVSASSLLYDSHQLQRMQPVLDAIGPVLDQHYWLPLYGRTSARACVPSPEEGSGVQGLARKALPCWPLFTEAHVTVDGHVSACSLDHSPRFHMGDLTALPFRKAWHSERFVSLRAAHLRGEVGATVCAHCVGYA